MCSYKSKSRAAMLSCLRSWNQWMINDLNDWLIVSALAYLSYIMILELAISLCWDRSTALQILRNCTVYCKSCILILDQTKQKSWLSPEPPLARLDPQTDHLHFHKDVELQLQSQVSRFLTFAFLKRLIVALCSLHNTLHCLPLAARGATTDGPDWWHFTGRHTDFVPFANSVPAVGDITEPHC